MKFATIRLWVQVTLSASLAAALAACTASQAEPANDLQVHGMLSTIELAPMHLAIAEFGAAQDPVQHGGIPNLYDGSRFNAATDADLAGHADTQALRESLKHPDLRIILTITEGHYRIIGNRAAGVASIAELKGKRVAMIEETSAHYYLDQLLALEGMGEDDITIVETGTPTGSSEFLVDRRADALAMWEPELQLAADKLGDDAISLTGDTGYYELYNLNTTAVKLADPETRAKIVRFVAKLIEAAEKVRNEPDAAMTLVASATGYPEENIRTSWEHHGFVASLAPNLLDTLTAQEAWLAARAGRPARSREELSVLIDPSIEQEARAFLAGD